MTAKPIWLGKPERQVCRQIKNGRTIGTIEWHIFKHATSGVIVEQYEASIDSSAACWGNNGLCLELEPFTDPDENRAWDEACDWIDAMVPLLAAVEKSMAD